MDEHFLEKLKEQGEKLAHFLSPIPITLVAPTELHQSLLKLNELMRLLTGRLSQPDQPKAEFELIMNHLIDPVIAECNNAGTRLGSVENQIFVVNCLHEVVVDFFV